MGVFSVIILILFLVFPEFASNGATRNLALCGTSVIGSIFPFMVASKMIVSSHIIKKDSVFVKGIAKIFNISASGAICLILGLLCGYPVGQKMLINMYDEGEITLGEVKKLSLFANNAGPAFVISTVGATFFKSTKTGIIIYFSHIAGSLITGFILKFFTNRYDMVASFENKTPHSPTLLIDSIRDGALSMLNVAAIITFFGALTGILEGTKILDSLTMIFPEPAAAKAVICGLLEMTTGLSLLASTAVSHSLKIIVAAMLISFSGLSVFAQIKAFCGNKSISLTNIIIAKGFSAVLSGIIAGIINILFTY
ncbi:MAG: hypothetical protein IJC74_04585 [Clostridia bacterium]|nr:hypothetical protein [Clostridia bacterium]